MTTNRIETLDEALLRPGRIDYRLYLGEASKEQKIELYRRFFPSASKYEATEFVESHLSAATMAEFQGLLLALEHDFHEPGDGRCPMSEGRATEDSGFVSVR